MKRSSAFKSVEAFYLSSQTDYMGRFNQKPASNTRLRHESKSPRAAPALAQRTIRFKRRETRQLRAESFQSRIQIQRHSLRFNPRVSLIRIWFKHVEMIRMNRMNRSAIATNRARVFDLSFDARRWFDWSTPVSIACQPQLENQNKTNDGGKPECQPISSLWACLRHVRKSSPEWWTRDDPSPTDNQNGANRPVLRSNSTNENKLQSISHTLNVSPNR